VRVLMATLPIALLVAYSQIIVKWRMGSIEASEASGFLSRLIKFIGDPYILSGYAAALVASFAWLYVVAKLPLSLAFPVYIGVTFVMVLFGGWWFLSETVNATKIAAVLMILAGIALGLHSDV
jgi:multidrug transporter EmrE-like cation transporter